MQERELGKTQPAETVTWSSEEILKGQKDVVIVHNGENYHLKKTQNDRLILMK